MTSMYEFDLILLLQQMRLLSDRMGPQSYPLVTPLLKVTIRLPHKVMCYLIFSVFCIIGTYFGLHINDSIANTRAIGAVLGAY